MSKATYYNEHFVGKEFDILSKNEDGTLNIGTGKTIVVGSVVVSKEPKHGQVTVAEEKPAVKTKE